MTPGDLDYLRYVSATGLLRGPVLEIGARAWQEEGNASGVCRELGLEWQGADLEPDGEEILRLDILDDDQVSRLSRTWPTVLLFNLLEHVYDPVAALRNAMRLVSPGGVCTVVSPTVWQIHDFPSDYWRPLPDFYTRFANVEGHELLERSARWIVGRRLVPMSAMVEHGQKLLPSKQSDSAYSNKYHGLYSRVIHRIFNTNGRSLFFPYCAFGVAMRRVDPHSR